MDIWAGSIFLDSSTPPLEELRLSTSSTSTAPPSVVSHLTKSFTSSTLSLIALVDPSRIPLFLAAGPSLELTTTSPTTQRYFRELFLSKLPQPSSSLPTCTPEQSRISLLVRVSSPTPTSSGDWSITELAIYGAITQVSGPSPDTTPPNSSPPVEDLNTSLATTTNTADNLRTIMTVHALPLSSNHAFPTFITPKPRQSSPFKIREDTPSSPIFIAPDPQDIINPCITNSGKKRGAQVIDSIVEKRKRAKFRQQSLSLPPPPPPLSLLSGKSLDRRSNIDSRSTPVLKEEPLPSPALPTPTTTTPAIVKQESGKARELLSRTVVARMKAHGIKDYRNSSGSSADMDVNARGGKEEYKNIYHHTLKAAIFALRNDSTTCMEKAKGVVDRLLGVFCGERVGEGEIKVEV